LKLQERSLWKTIKEEHFLPVYLVTGTEGYLKQKYCRLIAERAVPDSLRDFNFQEFSGDTLSMEELVLSAESIPIMSPRRCVLVHDLNFTALKDADWEALQTLIAEPFDTCVLIFWQDTQGFPRNTKKMKELYTAFDHAGAVVELNRRSTNDLVRYVGSECKKQGISIRPSAAQYLIESVGDDMSNLTTELEKLCSFSDGEITREDIDTICIKSLEATAFQMVDALMARNYDRVFSSIAVLFDQRTEPMMILGALVSTYSDMYRVKVMLQNGGRARDLKKLFPQAYRSDFKLEQAERRCRSFSLNCLRESLEILARADLTLKSSSEDPQTVLEQLMIELGMCRKRSA